MKRVSGQMFDVVHEVLLLHLGGCLMAWQDKEAPFNLST